MWFPSLSPFLAIPPALDDGPCPGTLRGADYLLLHTLTRQGGNSVFVMFGLVTACGQ